MKLLKLIRRRYQIDGAIGVVSSIPGYLLEPIQKRVLKRKIQYSGTDVVVRDGILIDLSHDLTSNQDSILLGHYEEDEVAFVRQYLPADIDVIELGAGIGYVSCVIQSVLTEKATHVAVEANERLLPVIERHCALNEAEVDVHFGAYATGASEVRFGSEKYLTGSVADANTESQLVPTTQLAELCAAYDIELFSLVIDIEGGEVDLFRSEMDLLESKCNIIIAELHPNSSGYDEMVSRLDNSSFEQVDRRWDVVVFKNKNPL